jgi:hypothetical protein
MTERLNVMMECVRELRVLAVAAHNIDDLAAVQTLERDLGIILTTIVQQQRTKRSQLLLKGMSRCRTPRRSNAVSCTLGTPTSPSAGTKRARTASLGARSTSVNRGHRKSKGRG